MKQVGYAVTIEDFNFRTEVWYDENEDQNCSQNFRPQISISFSSVHCTELRLWVSAGIFAEDAGANLDKASLRIRP